MYKTNTATDKANTETQTSSYLRKSDYHTMNSDSDVSLPDFPMDTDDILSDFLYHNGGAEKRNQISNHSNKDKCPPDSSSKGRFEALGKSTNAGHTKLTMFRNELETNLNCRVKDKTDVRKVASCFSLNKCCRWETSPRRSFTDLRQNCEHKLRDLQEIDAVSSSRVGGWSNMYVSPLFHKHWYVINNKQLEKSRRNSKSNAGQETLEDQLTLYQHVIEYMDILTCTSRGESNWYVADINRKRAQSVSRLKKCYKSYREVCAPLVSAPGSEVLEKHDSLVYNVEQNKPKFCVVSENSAGHDHQEGGKVISGACNCSVLTPGTVASDQRMSSTKEKSGLSSMPTESPKHQPGEGSITAAKVSLNISLKSQALKNKSDGDVHTVKKRCRTPTLDYLMRILQDTHESQQHTPESQQPTPESQQHTHESQQHTPEYQQHTLEYQQHTPESKQESKQHKHESKQHKQESKQHKRESKQHRHESKQHKLESKEQLTETTFSHSATSSTTHLDQVSSSHRTHPAEKHSKTDTSSSSRPKHHDKNPPEDRNKEPAIENYFYNCDRINQNIHRRLVSENSSDRQRTTLQDEEYYREEGAGWDGTQRSQQYVYQETDRHNLQRGVNHNDTDGYLWAHRSGNREQNFRMRQMKRKKLHTEVGRMEANSLEVERIGGNGREVERMRGNSREKHGQNSPVREGPLTQSADMAPEKEGPCVQSTVVTPLMDTPRAQSTAVIPTMDTPCVQFTNTNAQQDSGNSLKLSSSTASCQRRDIASNRKHHLLPDINSSEPKVKQQKTSNLASSEGSTNRGITAAKHTMQPTLHSVDLRPTKCGTLEEESRSSTVRELSKERTSNNNNIGEFVDRTLEYRFFLQELNRGDTSTSTTDDMAFEVACPDVQKSDSRGKTKYYTTGSAHDIIGMSDSNEWSSNTPQRHMIRLSNDAVRSQNESCVMNDEYKIRSMEVDEPMKVDEAKKIGGIMKAAENRCALFEFRLPLLQQCRGYQTCTYSRPNSCSVLDSDSRPNSCSVLDSDSRSNSCSVLDSDSLPNSYSVLDLNKHHETGQADASRRCPGLPDENRCANSVVCSQLSRHQIRNLVEVLCSATTPISQVSLGDDETTVARKKCASTNTDSSVTSATVSVEGQTESKINYNTIYSKDRTTIHEQSMTDIVGDKVSTDPTDSDVSRHTVCDKCAYDILGAVGKFTTQTLSDMVNCIPDRSGSMNHELDLIFKIQIPIRIVCEVKCEDENKSTDTSTKIHTYRRPEEIEFHLKIKSEQSVYTNLPSTVLERCSSLDPRRCGVRRVDTDGPKQQGFSKNTHKQNVANKHRSKQVDQESHTKRDAVYKHPLPRRKLWRKKPERGLQTDNCENADVKPVGTGERTVMDNSEFFSLLDSLCEIVTPISPLSSDEEDTAIPESLMLEPGDNSEQMQVFSPLDHVSNKSVLISPRQKGANKQRPRQKAQQSHPKRDAVYKQPIPRHKLERKKLQRGLKTGNCGNADVKASQKVCTNTNMSAGRAHQPVGTGKATVSDNSEFLSLLDGLCEIVTPISPLSSDEEEDTATPESPMLEPGDNSGQMQVSTPLDHSCNTAVLISPVPSDEKDNDNHTTRMLEPSNKTGDTDDSTASPSCDPGTLENLGIKSETCINNNSKNNTNNRYMVKYATNYNIIYMSSEAHIGSFVSSHFLNSQFPHPESLVSTSLFDCQFPHTELFDCQFPHTDRHTPTHNFSRQLPHTRTLFDQMTCDHTLTSQDLTPNNKRFLIDNKSLKRPHEIDKCFLYDKSPKLPQKIDKGFLQNSKLSSRAKTVSKLSRWDCSIDVTFRRSSIDALHDYGRFTPEMKKVPRMIENKTYLRPLISSQFKKADEGCLVNSDEGTFGDVTCVVLTNSSLTEFTPEVEDDGQTSKKRMRKSEGVRSSLNSNNNADNETSRNTPRRKNKSKSGSDTSKLTQKLLKKKERQEKQRHQQEKSQQAQEDDEKQQEGDEKTHLPELTDVSERYGDAQNRLREVRINLLKTYSAQQVASHNSSFTSVFDQLHEENNNTNWGQHGSAGPTSSDENPGTLPQIPTTSTNFVGRSSSFASASEQEKNKVLKFVQRMNTNYGEKFANGNAMKKERLNKLCTHYLSMNWAKKQMGNQLQQNADTLPSNVSLGNSSKLKSQNDFQCLPVNTPETHQQLTEGLLVGKAKMRGGLNVNSTDKLKTTTANIVADSVRKNTIRLSETKSAKNKTDNQTTSIETMPKSDKRNKTNKKCAKLKAPVSKRLNPDIEESVNRLSSRPPSEGLKLLHNVQSWEQEFGRPLSVKPGQDLSVKPGKNSLKQANVSYVQTPVVKKERISQSRHSSNNSSSTKPEHACKQTGTRTNSSQTSHEAVRSNKPARKVVISETGHQGTRSQQAVEDGDATSSDSETSSDSLCVNERLAKLSIHELVRSKSAEKIDMPDVQEQGNVQSFDAMETMCARMQAQYRERNNTLPNTQHTRDKHVHAEDDGEPEKSYEAFGLGTLSPLNPVIPEESPFGFLNLVDHPPVNLLSENSSNIYRRLEENQYLGAGGYKDGKQTSAQRSTPTTKPSERQGQQNSSEQKSIKGGLASGDNSGNEGCEPIEFIDEVNEIKYIANIAESQFTGDSGVFHAAALPSGMGGEFLRDLLKVNKNNEAGTSFERSEKRSLRRLDDSDSEAEILAQMALQAEAVDSQISDDSEENDAEEELDDIQEDNYSIDKNVSRSDNIEDNKITDLRVSVRHKTAERNTEVSGVSHLFDTRDGEIAHRSTTSNGDAEKDDLCGEIAKSNAGSRSLAGESDRTIPNDSEDLESLESLKRAADVSFRGEFRYVPQLGMQFLDLKDGLGPSYVLPAVKQDRLADCRGLSDTRFKTSPKLSPIAEVKDEDITSPPGEFQGSQVSETERQHSKS